MFPNVYLYLNWIEMKIKFKSINRYSLINDPNQIVSFVLDFIFKSTGKIHKMNCLPVNVDKVNIQIIIVIIFVVPLLVNVLLLSL